MELVCSIYPPGPSSSLSAFFCARRPCSKYVPYYTYSRGCASYDFWQSRVVRANFFLSNLSKFFDDGQNCRSPFGVRIITLCQLNLCYYLLSRYETLLRHKPYPRLCRQEVWWLQVLIPSRISWQTMPFFWQNSDFNAYIVVPMLLIDNRHGSYQA